MSDEFRLRDNEMMAFVATCDPVRSRVFYEETLGLRLVSEELPFALVFDLGGTMLRVTVVAEMTPAGYTVLGWRVADIAAGVEALRRAGVVFQFYPGMRQDESGIWRAPSGAKVAWFKDPDGNVLSISEH